MILRTLLLLSACALAAGAAPVSGQEPLTLAEALALAAEHNETPKVAEARLERSQALRRQAIASLLPALTVSSTYTRRRDEVTRTIDDEEVTVQAVDAFASQAVAETTLFDLRALPLVRAAGREVEAQRLESAELERALAHDVAAGFFTVLGAERLLDATRERVRIAAATLEEADLRLEAGLAGRNDVTRTRLELATARLAETRAAAGVDAARLSLAFLTAAPVERRPLVEPADPPANLDERQRLIESALAARADLAAVAERAAQAEQIARVPRYALAPRLDARSLYRRTNESGLAGREEDWNLAIGLTWEIYDGGARRALAAQRDAEATEARLAVDRRRREIALEVADAETALSSSQATVVQAEARLEAARANAAEVAERYSAGLATVLERADAAVEQFEAEAELVRQRYARALSRLALGRALGAWPTADVPPTAAGENPP
jgi:OMF family outer membrane factor